MDRIVEQIEGWLSNAHNERLRIFVATCADEIKRQDKSISGLREQLDSAQLQTRTEVLRDLCLDAARRAAGTRAKERIKRIGIILTNGALIAEKPDADEVEEFMRVAMELSDLDFERLGELVRIEGDVVRNNERIARYDAYTRWTQGAWGERKSGDQDSVFSKLESYGLVARIPPPNNLNITADFQNRYALLRKGLRFAELSLSAALESASGTDAQS